MSFNRGHSRGGRGSYQGRRPTQSAWPRPHISSLPSPPKGDLIDKIKWDQLASDTLVYIPDGHIGIDNVAVVASYNWVGTDHPTIMIPGKPPLWTPLNTPEKLTEDDSINNTYYVDPNAAYASKHTLNPAVTAIMKMEPNCLEGPELFACGSTLGQLLRFVLKSDRSFRMLVQTVGSTVHLVRRLNSPTETIEDIRGYGHSFPDAYTTWEPEVKESKSHQRVIRYRLGGLPTLLRYEGDGYISNSQSVKLRSSAEEDNEDALAELFGGLSAGSGDTAYRYKDADLKVEDGGEEVAQKTTFDLKTRSIKSSARDTLGEEMPRLWVRQIENFILAYHNRGVFTDIKEEDTRKGIDDWEEDNQEVLKRFMRCLRWIMDKAQSKEREASEFELLCDGSDTLEMREKLEDAGNPLSLEVKDKWEDWLSKRPAPYQARADIDARLSSSDLSAYEKNGETGSSDDDYVDYGLHHEYDSSPYQYYGADFEEEDKDLTACDKGCGYCGKCAY